MEDDSKKHGSISEFGEDKRDKNEKHLEAGDKIMEDESLNKPTERGGDGDDTNQNESDEEKQQKQEVVTRILEHDSDKEEIGKLEHVDRESHGEAENAVDENPVSMDRGKELTQDEFDMAEQTENMAEQELLDPDKDLQNYQELLDEVLEAEAREEETGEEEVGHVEGGEEEVEYDEANGDENKEDEIAGDEEEFADTEDQELKQVTEDDENLHESELLKVEEELLEEHLEEHGEKLEQEYDYEREQEDDDMETRGVSASKGIFEEDDQQRRMSPLVSASPHSYRSGGSSRHTAVDYGDEQNEEEEEEEEEEMENNDSRISREELVERYHQALTERHQLQEHNYQLQHKLSEYFRRKRSDDSRLEDRNVTDQEQRYLKNMAVLDDLRQEEQKRNVIFRAELDELKQRCKEKQEQVDQERFQLMEHKKEVALLAVNSRTGKTIPPKDVEQYLNTENRKEAEVVAVRLENIKLKNRLKKEEVALKSKEELAEGLHLIDFEQLKIENQTYNEKIEERNEELLKLRRKITSTVQVLTHLKEKLQFVQNENQTEKAQLRAVEELVGKRRDTLSRLKQARDALRFDNQNIHQNGGLLGNRPLLCDFEDRKDEADDLSQKLSQLKMRHAELTLSLRAVRKKVEASKQR